MQPHHATLRRREQLSLEEFYDEYCGDVGVPKEIVGDLLGLLERLTGTPAGYMRPWDSLLELGLDSQDRDSLDRVELLMTLEEAGASEVITVGDFLAQAALARRRAGRS